MVKRDGKPLFTRLRAVGLYLFKPSLVFCPKYCVCLPYNAILFVSDLAGRPDAPNVSQLTRSTFSFISVGCPDATNAELKHRPRRKKEQKPGLKGNVENSFQNGKGERSSRTTQAKP